MNDTYCHATHGSLTCTLHRGHAGNHYDSTRDESFGHAAQAVRAWANRRAEYGSAALDPSPREIARDRAEDGVGR
jgi:hypothetical protein